MGPMLQKGSEKTMRVNSFHHLTTFPVILILSEKEFRSADVWLQKTSVALTITDIPTKGAAW